MVIFWKKILDKKGYDVEFVIPDEKIEEETLDICRRYGLDPMRFKKKIDLDDKNAKYILVDHSERELGGEIICIIDHHPVNKEAKIANNYNREVSSTACYICRESESLLDVDNVKLALVATLVDTAFFRSTKGRKEDEKWVKNICCKYGFNYGELYKEGLCLTSLVDIEKASLNGLKRYIIVGKKVESSYIQVESCLLKTDLLGKIVGMLQGYVKEFGIDMFVFIAHDMTNFKTMCYMISDNEIAQKYYDVYSSRGNTIISDVEGKLRGKIKINNL